MFEFFPKYGGTVQPGYLSSIKITFLGYELLKCKVIVT